MVEIQVVSTDMLTKTVFQIHHACNTLPRTSIQDHVMPLTFAEIAHGHPLLKTRLVQMVAKLLTTRNTTLATTTP